MGTFKEIRGRVSKGMEPGVGSSGGWYESLIPQEALAM